VYNKKLDEVPKILASKRGVGLAKIAWKMYHDRGDDGFQQASFDEYVKQAIDSQRKMRESTSESPAAKDMNIDVDVTTGSDPKKGDVVDVVYFSNADSCISFSFIKNGEKYITRMGKRSQQLIDSINVFAK
jgi:hypothetical protein